MIDVATIPNWFKNAIGEAKDQNILNGLFPQVVVDAVDLVLGEVLMRRCVEEPGSAETRRIIIWLAGTSYQRT